MCEKLKLALYWGATCGGCDIAVLDLDEKILDVIEIADIVFWPIAIDFKYKDLEAMKEKSIDVTLYNGAIRNSENEHIAKVLREKSKIMIAFGACACFGGIPGLANISDREEIFEVAYKETPSTVNPEFITPQTGLAIDGEKLFLPEFYDTVKSLDQVVKVDYYIPACPPPVDLIATAVEAIKTGELPPIGSVIGPKKSLCDECDREKEEKARIREIKRVYEGEPNPEKCFLDQGYICLGPATRGGCGKRCINANMPCRGCMGPTDEVIDQGAKMISALASIMKEDMDPVELVKMVKDPLGMFYRFTLPHSIISRRVDENERK